MSVLATQVTMQQLGMAPKIASTEEQAEHAVSPNDFNFDVQVKDIILTIAAFFIIIYMLQLMERKLS